jgi:hypothetical protein
VYHSWGIEPELQPPTPNPPHFSDLEDDGPRLQREDSAGSDRIEYSHGPLAANFCRIPPADRQPLPHHSFSPLLLKGNFFKKGANHSNGPLEQDANHAFGKTKLREDLFSDEPEGRKQRLLGRLEGMLIGQWSAGAGLSLEESYAMVGLDYPDEIVQRATKTVPTVQTDAPSEFQAVPSRDASPTQHEPFATTFTPLNMPATLEAPAPASGGDGAASPASFPTINPPTIPGVDSCDQMDAGERAPSPHSSYSSGLSDPPSNLSELEDFNHPTATMPLFGLVPSPAGSMFQQAAAASRNTAAELGLPIGKGKEPVRQPGFNEVMMVGPDGRPIPRTDTIWSPKPTENKGEEPIEQRDPARTETGTEEEEETTEPVGPGQIGSAREEAEETADPADPEQTGPPQGEEAQETIDQVQSEPNLSRGKKQEEPAEKRSPEPLSDVGKRRKESKQADVETLDIRKDSAIDSQALEQAKRSTRQGTKRKSGDANQSDPEPEPDQFQTPKVNKQQKKRRLSKSTEGGNVGGKENKTKGKMTPPPKPKETPPTRRSARQAEKRK